MFTGIIEAIGTISGIAAKGVDQSIRINTGKLSLSQLNRGDSIAVSGVCLSVVHIYDDGVATDLSAETLSRTTLSDLEIGRLVNLELALTPASRIGGHLVMGHVDGIGRVVERNNDGRCVRLSVKAPDALARYLSEKGSIGLDGVSLTVNGVRGGAFDVNLIPHTLVETTLGRLQRGHAVNLEVDIIARYLERLMAPQSAAQSEQGPITLEFLAEHGFIGDPTATSGDD
ncbi:MAG: riboflavin synthase [Gammaproteobacteria bacterium]|nr:riboflavin synthase [Gammaproteobacteria bacterium]MCI0591697.1 riboflavin synthase [Gammaproteobacteria bacterium]